VPTADMLAIGDGLVAGQIFDFAVDLFKTLSKIRPSATSRTTLQELGIDMLI